MLARRLLTPASSAFAPLVLRTRQLPSTASFLQPLTAVRHASHKSEGKANRAKRGPGKRLGAKKTGGQLVYPDEIIYRQRGTVWHPGDNVRLGRDHTITSMITGYVRYYKDEFRNPDKQFIGVVHEADDVLPLQPKAARRRRLALQEVDRVERDLTGPEGMSLKTNGVWRISNWELGAEMDKGAAEVKPYEKGDRWLAWRKRTKRFENNRLKRTVKG